RTALDPPRRGRDPGPVHRGNADRDPRGPEPSRPDARPRSAVGLGGNGMLTTFADLSTPLIADACLRRDVPLRAAPPGIRAVVPGRRIAGRALPARHYGSVDVFLEAYARAEQGDVLVVDNGGRSDEACVGSLTVLEAEAAG